MKTGRLEAFSDGVLAIIITIMVLELKAPHEITLEALLPVIPVFVSYIVSFVYIGIYWNNHHHLFQITEKVNGKILWANLHLLFWLSLIPFTTSWIGENHLAPYPVAAYGLVLLMSAIAFNMLYTAIVKHHDEEAHIHKIDEGKLKRNISLILYIAGIALSFVNVWLAIACYMAVAIIWFIPLKAIERIME